LWRNLCSAWITIKSERHITVWIKVTIWVVSRPEKYWCIYKEATARVVVKTTATESATVMESATAMEPATAMGSATATVRVGGSDAAEYREYRDTCDCKFLHPGHFHSRTSCMHPSISTKARVCSRCAALAERVDGKCRQPVAKYSSLSLRWQGSMDSASVTFKYFSAA
jgi:hypothetical protein